MSIYTPPWSTLNMYYNTFEVLSHSVPNLFYFYPLSYVIIECLLAWLFPQTRLVFFRSCRVRIAEQTTIGSARQMRTNTTTRHRMVSTTSMTVFTLISRSFVSHSPLEISQTASTCFSLRSIWMKWCRIASKGHTWLRLLQSGVSAACILSPSGRKRFRTWSHWVGVVKILWVFWGFFW